MAIRPVVFWLIFFAVVAFTALQLSVAEACTIGIASLHVAGYAVLTGVALWPLVDLDWRPWRWMSIRRLGSRRCKGYLLLLAAALAQLLVLLLLR